ncbi:hypothetical protein AeMF1_008528 [Aphanomyces euteiches]|nr:hypothetical protein AeMF1_008528 [Aphanomyces euteiches]KAH9182177.1 hypothetical protein AeNC1_015847 [Aphanomyces euteiches]
MKVTQAAYPGSSIRLAGPTIHDLSANMAKNDSCVNTVRVKSTVARHFRKDGLEQLKKALQVIGRVVCWLACLTIEVVAYLVVPYWIYMDIASLLANLLSPSYDLLSYFDPGPTVAAWDVSLYTGFNTTAHENELLLRRLIDQIIAMPRESQLDVPVAAIPFTVSLGVKRIFLQSVSRTNQTLQGNSSRYSLMVGKTFSMAEPIFNPLESLVLLIRIDNKVHGYETLRVLQTTNANATHQSLKDVTDQYPSLFGQARHAICVTNYDSGTNMCGSIVLPPSVVDSLIVDEQKTNGKPEAHPSCNYPIIPNMFYSIMDADEPKHYCASDPTLVADIRAFENWMVMTGIPTIPDQHLLGTATYIPSG